ncbi:MAG: class I SAM-dependent methyltransferase [Chlamydiales bacterium]
MYALLDSGDGKKLEQFGTVILSRPAAQALWHPQHPELWKPTATFSRDNNMEWQVWGKLPDSWNIEVNGIKFKLKCTDFGHLGIFPEQAPQWEWMQKRAKGARILNLFAYSGGSSLACAAGEVTHVDAAKGMIHWAAENAKLNGVNHIRWIIEDARKFLKRELRRNAQYDAIILDPPSFGRGKSKEVFKIEEDLPSLLDDCVTLLSHNARFILLTSHTPGYTPIVLRQLLQERLKGGVEAGEMVLPGPFDLPSGAFARWTP